MPIYQLDSITKRYGERVVLSLPALAIEQGEILAIVGPSGAGKSTLLRLLNFLESPTSGSINFNGQPVSPNPPLGLLRQVTTVFQRPIMLSRSVSQNVAYGLSLRGLPASEAVTIALERVGLAGRGQAAAATLSGGELQRIALARALVIKPQVLLLDEATANLDPYNVGLIESIVREEHQEQGTTVVMVTHNVFQARRLAQRVGLMLAGSLIELAPVEQFFNAPTDARTAAFTRGEMIY